MNASDKTIFRNFMLTVLVACSASCSTNAVLAEVSAFRKATAPISGGIGMAPRPADRTEGMTGSFAPPHKTPDGRACISVSPLVRPQIINPKIIDQIVIVGNNCGQTIKVEICYAGSTDCITVPLNAYQRVQRILGISPGSTTFRYEYRELY
ncbi:hypothetical protein [Bradyrhizobium commune]|uniref:Uncharacterized protein n=1 Tax=Bradyrhizobium commune TaxID=83627 RepID=A0A7S9D332_9BRAD|nr:hypothetical protein [Bradyrhizobium commune]QPF90281.1 hypothetical protein IC761_27840 [Bradyrhizobium commune]